MGAEPILRVHPASGAAPRGMALSDAELIALYSPADRAIPRVRANFISSIDGSATSGGLSGELGGPADKRVFDIIRQVADVVLVAAGTVRSEGYGPMRVGLDAAAWRLANGLPEHPAFAIVTASLDLDPSSPIFTDAPVRPIIVTTASASPERRARLEPVADVVVCSAENDKRVDARRLIDALVARGLTQIHCEGGPSLLGTLIDADVLDELCLTVSPNLEGGAGPRITHGDAAIGLRAMTLEHLLLAGSMMFTRWSRPL
jgi:riboflavin biosynthesis pyrimidine reductase